MSTAFFNAKKYGKKFLYSLLAAFVFFVASYAVVLARAEKVTLKKTFYFLVSSSTHVEASTHTAHRQGGAGYLLSSGKKDYVAYAVYFSASDGFAVQTALSDLGERTFLLERKAEHLYLKKGTEKKKSQLYANAFTSLYGVMRALYGEIARLEKGATQRSSQEIVATFSRQLTYLSRAYANEYSAFSSLCRGAGTQLSSVSKDTVYAKDLRYALCALADGYLRLASTFSI